MPRVEDSIPHQGVTCETQNNAERIETYLAETVHVEPAPERESSSEEELERQNESVPCAEEPQPYHEQELAQVQDPEREIQDTQHDTQHAL